MPHQPGERPIRSSPVPADDFRVGKIVTVCAAVVSLVSLVIVVIAMPAGVHRSPDPGTPTTSLWMILLPAVVVLGLTRLLPLATPDVQPLVRDRRVVRRDVVILMGCVVAFPLVIGIGSLNASAWYYLVKLAVLIGLPLMVVLRSRGSIQVPAPRQRWQWVPPILIVVIWAFLSVAAPWGPPQADYSSIDPVLLVIQSTLTLITASVAEEIFYRRWLQTRVEGLLGRWAGIAVGSLAFAVMHLGGNRQPGGAVVEVAAAVVIQGSFGLMLGYLWSRYRNIWICILIHVLTNGFGIAVFLLTGG